MQPFGTVALGPYQEAVATTLQELAEQRAIARIWERDFTLWQPEPTEIANRLGWLDIPEELYGQLDMLNNVLSEAACASRYTHALVLGMGGSSLAPELFGKVFGDDAPGGCYPTPRLHLAILDSTAPANVRAAADALDPARALFVVSTKSGGTVETLSFMKHFYNWTAAALGKERAGEHFIAITDPGSKLVTLAEQLGFRGKFLNNPNIGGRYSALSYFGLIPAALAGVNVAQLLKRALTMRRACQHEAPAANPGAWLGAVMATLTQAGRDKLTLIVSEPLASFGDWVEQLVAESTGKAAVGILPVVGEPLGSPEVYGEDRLFVHLRLADDDTHDAGVAALSAAGHPVIRIDLDDIYDLGPQFFLWEFATAIASARLGINPYDQPNVEAAKVLARQLVESYTEEGTLPESTPAPLTPAALEAFLVQAQPGDYIAIQAYVPTTPETDAALQALRTRLRERTRLATTVGYGPRYLHSTGQLHKGDAGNGLFIHFTADIQQDLPIPDAAGSEASALTFGVLQTAQAFGDRQALLDAGRRVIHFHLSADVVADIETLL